MFRRDGWAILLFLAVFVLYLLTLSPTFQPDDSAETVAACFTLTPQHPSGYPLYTFLGRLACLLPVGSEAFRVNLLSALLGSLGILLTALFLYRNLSTLDEKKNSLLVPCGALTGALFLALSKTYWAQALSAKGGIYMLQAITFWAWVFFLTRKDTSRASTLLLGAFGLGLAAAVGWETSLLFALASLAVLGLREPSKIKKHFTLKQTAWAASFILIGLSVYLLLPLRSQISGTITWGPANTWSGSLRFLTAADLRQEKLMDYAGRGLHSLVPQWIRISQDLTAEMSLVTWALALAGVFLLFRSKKLVFLSFGLATSLLLVLSTAFIFHTEPENLWCLDKFLIPVSIFKAACVGVGIGALGLLLRARFQAKALKRWAPLGGALLVATSLWTLYGLSGNLRANASGARVWAYDRGADLLRSLDKNALFFVEGDNPLFSTLYFQEVLGERPDVTLIPAFYLWEPWGHKALEARLPGYDLDNVRPRVQGNPVLQTTAAILHQNGGKRPVQFSPNLDLLDTNFFSKIPEVQTKGIFTILRPQGLTLTWNRKKYPLARGSISLRERHASERDPIPNEAFDILFAMDAQAYFNKGLYLFQNGYKDWAEVAYRSALKRTNNRKLSARILVGLGDLLEASGKKQEALDTYIRSIESYPEPGTYSRLIRAFLSKGLKDVAYGTALRETREFPMSRSAWHDLAACEAALGHTQAAEAAYQQGNRFTEGH